MNPLLLLVNLLTPWEIPQMSKIRLGGPYDGGYVILDHQLDQINASLSYGVGKDWTFDLDLANHTGSPVYMFDHTIGQVVTNHPLVSHIREGVSPTPFMDRGMKLDTVVHHLNHYVPGWERGDTRLFLKMDIEYGEFPVLEDLDEAIIGKFDQIVMEIHDMQRNTSRTTNLLAKLNRTHVLVHVHGNNCCGGFLLPDAKGWVPKFMDLTWFRRDLAAEIVPNTQTYPTPLDGPTLPNRPDYDLGFFPFSPETIEHNEL